MTISKVGVQFVSMERAETPRGVRGRDLVGYVNRALASGANVDANTYFEAITEAEDANVHHHNDWMFEESKNEFDEALGQTTIRSRSAFRRRKVDFETEE